MHLSESYEIQQRNGSVRRERKRLGGDPPEKWTPEITGTMPIGFDLLRFGTSNCAIVFWRAFLQVATSQEHIYIMQQRVWE